MSRCIKHVIRGLFIIGVIAQCSSYGIRRLTVLKSVVETKLWMRLCGWSKVPHMDISYCA